VLVSIPFAALAVLAVLLAQASASLSAGTGGLAGVTLPFGGGHVQRVFAFLGRGAEGQSVPVHLQDGQIVPSVRVRPGVPITVVADIARPGWLSWLTGARQQIRRTVVTPRSHLTSAYLIRRGGAPLELAFSAPVSWLTYRSGDRTTRVRLARATTRLAVPVTGSAGTLAVAAAPMRWERPSTEYVSWFPPGARATALAIPAPGSAIGTHTPLTLTFNTPVATALDGSLPPVSPAGVGRWRTLNAHTIRFVPAGYGYGLGAHVTVGLPGSINVVGATVHGSDPTLAYTVPPGSTLRLQQLLAHLGYLPVDFTASASAPAPTLPDEEAEAIHPPAGTFRWRWPNTPASLRAMWSPGSAGELTRGAVMAFENDHGLVADGVASPAVWRALIEADLRGQRSTFGYTFVRVSEGSPETESTWHNGRTVVSGAVNTGIAAAPTATGTFAVFEHIPVTTMSGTNPDGTTYHDPGIRWVSYFNGGDALHEFPRASYGSPQSLGCVEMPESEAAAVYRYTPIGTIVNVVP
jgi:peptidoglycan hydrolase-like protein with peptidoglycan-binding domain